MGRLLGTTACLLAPLCALLAAGDLQADTGDFDFSADLRAVASNGLRSYLNGGLGKLRFDDTHDGLRLGDLYAGWRHDLSDLVHLNIDLVAYGDQRPRPIDLTEAYVELRPYPRSEWRSRLKFGAFYPPVSLENRLRGWRTPYTISPSAINSWVGEELRTIGAEYNLEWLGLERGHDFEVGLTAAVYGWNDPAGVLMSYRGWAIHDRPTTLFGTAGSDGSGPRLFYYHDIDGRAGYYAGGSLRYRSVLEVRLLHYDNHADPTRCLAAINGCAWRTRFDSAGLRWTPDAQWTVIVQWLLGHTAVDDEGPSAYESWGFDSAFALANWQRGAHQLSLRYDGFHMRQLQSAGGFFTGDNGHAWTAAYSYDLSSHWNVALEALQIDSVMPQRSAYFGEPAAARERELQLAVRFEL